MKNILKYVIGGGTALAVFVSTVVFAPSADAIPAAKLVCSARLWSATWCGPCQGVKKDLGIKTDADWATRFGSRLSVNDVDVTPLPPPQTTVPFLQTFDQTPAFIASYTERAAIVAQLKELEKNIKRNKCPAVVTPTPRPTSTPRPTVTPRPTTTVRPTATPRPRFSPIPGGGYGLDQLSARGIDSPIMDGISNVFSWFFSRIGSGFMALIELFTE